MPTLNVETDLDIFGYVDRKTGTWRPSGKFTILFETEELVPTFRFGRDVYRVDEFIADPVRCLRCSQYGHIKKECVNNEVCYDCGEIRHEGECEKGKRCVQCNGTDHNSMDKRCVMRKFMMRVQEYCKKHNVDQMEVMRFAAEVTDAFSDEVEQATTETEKSNLKLRWKGSFKAETLDEQVKNKLMRINRAEKAAKPPITMNLLGTMFRNLGETFKVWQRQSRMQRSFSYGNLTSSRRNNVSFASQLKLNGNGEIGEKPFTAQPRLDIARKTQDMSEMELIEEETPRESWEELAIAQQVNKDEDGMDDSFTDDEAAQTSLISQASDDGQHTEKKVKQDSGSAKKLVTKNPQTMSQWVDIHYGKKNPNNET